MKAFAAEAARSVGRRLRARRGGHVVARSRVRGHAAPPQPAPRSIPLPQAPSPDDVDATPVAGEAELDALRGALVRELDRLAADDDCSASFRRA